MEQLRIFETLLKTHFHPGVVGTLCFRTVEALIGHFDGIYFDVDIDEVSLGEVHRGDADGVVVGEVVWHGDDGDGLVALREAPREGQGAGAVGAEAVEAWVDLGGGDRHRPLQGPAAPPHLQAEVQG